VSASTDQYGCSTGRPSPFPFKLSQHQLFRPGSAISQCCVVQTTPPAGWLRKMHEIVYLRCLILHLASAPTERATCRRLEVEPDLGLASWSGGKIVRCVCLHKADKPHHAEVTLQLSSSTSECCCWSRQSQYEFPAACLSFLNIFLMCRLDFGIERHRQEV
jgi:hypothetical protein